MTMPAAVGAAHLSLNGAEDLRQLDGSGTSERKLPFLDHRFDFIRYTVTGQTSETSKPAWRKSLII